jgi:hypothetical protein
MNAARQIAALRQWAFIEDPAAQTANARAKFLDRFEKEADPDNRLSAEERSKRAERLRRAYFKELAAKSAAVRRARSLKARIPAGDAPVDGAGGSA